jgi:hypothetical protein
MRKKAFILAVIYSALVIAFKVFIWKGGHTFEPGYRWSHAFTLLAIIPFIFYGVRSVRDDNGGFIRGKLAGQTGMTITFFAGIILFIYHYFEFKYSLGMYSDYYHSAEFMTMLEADPNAKKVGAAKAAELMIADLSPFKAATMKLISLFVIAFPTSFLCAVFLKKYPEA